MARKQNRPQAGREGADSAWTSGDLFAESEVSTGNDSEQGELNLKVECSSRWPFARGRQPYRYREVPCKKCGGHWFRENRRDCQECRRRMAKSWALIRCATHDVIRFGVFRSPCENAIRATADEYLEFLRNGCAKIGTSLQDYGMAWAIYHRRPLRSFEYQEHLDRANRIENLAVRLRHNRPKATGQSRAGELVTREGSLWIP